MTSRRTHGYSKDQNAFNEWHRQESIKRYIHPKDAGGLVAMDLDLLEYDWDTGQVVLLHEVAEDRGQNNKQTRVMRQLAEQAGCHALCTLYTLSNEYNPENPDVLDISWFRARRVWPNPQHEFISMNPAEYARRLNIYCKRLKRSKRLESA